MDYTVRSHIFQITKSRQSSSIIFFELESHLVQSYHQYTIQVQRITLQIPCLCSNPVALWKTKFRSTIQHKHTCFVWPSKRHGLDWKKPQLVGVTSTPLLRIKHGILSLPFSCIFFRSVTWQQPRYHGARRDNISCRRCSKILFAI